MKKNIKLLYLKNKINLVINIKELKDLKIGQGLWLTIWKEWKIIWLNFIKIKR